MSTRYTCMFYDFCRFHLSPKLNRPFGGLRCTVLSRASVSPRTYLWIDRGGLSVISAVGCLAISFPQSVSRLYNGTRLPAARYFSTCSVYRSDAEFYGVALDSGKPVAGAGAMFLTVLQLSRRTKYTMPTLLGSLIPSIAAGTLNGVSASHSYSSDIDNAFLPRFSAVYRVKTLVGTTGNACRVSRQQRVHTKSSKSQQS
ncbi:hypothetical protein C8Q79DRAFT_325491 [Trametes meyenii]|nr:hypothetical protein C8Q79DRAFT_325491 [Trametes meyenii]